MNKIIEHRRWLHQNAELSFEEFRTQEYICNVLTELGIKHQKVAGTGVLAEIGNNPQNTVVLRADIDALPIKESAKIDFRSLNEGVMHACGHDMHTAALLGALEELSKNPPQNRTVLGLFQPGEEMHPGGATKVLAEGVFDGYNIVAFMGQHCSPELPTGTFGIRQGEFMASTDELHIKINGKGGHAAQPALLKNPVWAAVELLERVHNLTPTNDTPHILAFGRIIADGATNVIPDEVYIEGTFRTFSEQWRGECKIELQKIATDVASKHELEIDIEIKDGYPSVYNNEELSNQAQKIFEQKLNQISLIEIPKRMTAEDFGFYGKHYRTLFLRMGVGNESENSTRLHTGDFCPDERSLELGASVMVAMARNLK